MANTEPFFLEKQSDHRLSELEIVLKAILEGDFRR